MNTRTHYIVSTNGVDLSTTYTSKARAIETAQVYVWGAERMERKATEQTHTIEVRTRATGKVVYSHSVKVPALAPQSPPRSSYTLPEGLTPECYTHLPMGLGTPCQWSPQGSRCGSGKDAVHLITRSVPNIPAGTAVCAFHSPFDVEPGIPEPSKFCPDMLKGCNHSMAQSERGFGTACVEYCDTHGIPWKKRTPGSASAEFIGGVHIARRMPDAKTLAV